MLTRFEPKIQWRQLLRLFTQSSRKTRVRNTISRPSKRYGTTPGVKIARRQNIFVAVDTSGSIEAKELELFFSEIYHIHRQGAQITVLECDTEIQAIYRFRGVAPVEIHGRGGTDFNAPIRYANEKLPDCLIYFTDGRAKAPEIRCRRPILWVVTSGGISTSAWNSLAGRKLKL